MANTGTINGISKINSKVTAEFTTNDTYCYNYVKIKFVLFKNKFLIVLQDNGYKLGFEISVKIGGNYYGEIVKIIPFKYY